jgi:hypothetical protein
MSLPNGARRCARCGDLFVEMDGSTPEDCADCRSPAAVIAKADFTRDVLESRGRALREVIEFCERQLSVVKAALQSLPPERMADEVDGKD